MNTENMYFVLYNIFTNEARSYYGYNAEYLDKLTKYVKDTWCNGDVILPVKIKNIYEDDIEKLCKKVLKDIIFQ